MTSWVVAFLAVAPWQSLDAGAREEQRRALTSEPLERRFLLATEGFLGTPYVLSPLGEGAGHDPDPLWRVDAADCLTMVEESMALALAPDDEHLVETLNHIRYEAEPSYEGRLHVMEAQWVPVNLGKGLLEDVTRRYGKDATRRVSKTITAATWKEKSGQSLGLSEPAQAKGEFSFELIPADRTEAALATAPEGTIVVVVRADRPRFVSRITHVAVLVQKPSGPHLRHASRTFKRVVDEPVEKYLKRNLEFGAWTVEGVSLYQLHEPRWLAALTPDAGASADASDAGPSAVVEVPEVPVADAGVEKGQHDRARTSPCGCSSAGGLVLGLLAWLTARRAR